jgi:hypothetical protein
MWSGRHRGEEARVIDLEPYLKGIRMSESGAATEMPRYKCHKQVHALKIAAMEVRLDQSATIAPADAGYAPFTTAPGWSARSKASDADPGYYVVYDDGYASWSPTKAFEEGYTRL